MRLRLIREPTVNGATLGCLFVDGHFHCFTLEDAIRDAKVAGKTAIPANDYVVLVTPSHRFQRELPELMDVPGFTGIRIHAGNTVADTEGCILVGKDRQPGRVLQSRIALEALMETLRGATSGIQIVIEPPYTV